MPTNRRHRPVCRRADVQALALDQMLELLTGDTFYGGFGDDIDAMADAWEGRRERILIAWLDRFPGTRPFGWWLFQGVPDRGERRQLDPDQPRPECRDNWLTRGIAHTDTIPPFQEDQAAYLARHHLLTDAEAGDLAAGRGEAPCYPWELARELATG